jgi:hypothetical protein
LIEAKRRDAEQDEQGGVPQVQVHNRTKYKAGCRCDVCRKAQSDYRKDLRLRSKARVPAGTVSSLKSVPSLPSASKPSKPGQVESAVLAEIEGLTSAVRRPGLVESARAMARVLDTPLYVAQHPAAAARLMSALDSLHKGADRRASWLTSVRAMTPRA